MRIPGHRPKRWKKPAGRWCGRPCRRRSRLGELPEAPVAKPPKEEPTVKSSRRRRDAEAEAESSPAVAETSGPASKAEAAKEPGEQWHRFVQRIQERKRWSMQGAAHNYAKHGLPRSVDGPARGLGKHLGRWGYREIRPWW